MPDLRSTLPSSYRSATLLAVLTQPLAGALASNSLEPEDTEPFFLSIFTNLQPV